MPTRNLPPLYALRVFEVAARKDSYVEAAAELGLTHGAVSRQIAILEAWKGQRLFTRVGRRMVATPVARAFAGEVGYAFDRIVEAADVSGRPDARRILRLSAPTSFAMRWLIPRLDYFHQARPDLEVVVTTVSTAHEELRGGYDVAIRQGGTAEGAWPRHRAIPVLEDADTLIASPALLACRPIHRAEDVSGHVLLATETRPGDWIDWLRAAGLPHLAGRPRRLYDHFFITRQAVEDGLGLAIGPMPLLQRDVASGRLATPLPHIQVSRPGYVALIPLSAAPDGASEALVRWLVAEQERTASSHPCTDVSFAKA
jgi:LysR family transcriptional regulator, glycine cleavage system transcriptional activator